MCGRINLGDLTEEELGAYYGFGIVPERLLEDLPKRWNVPPTSRIPVIRRDAGGFRLDLARWGLIPAFFRRPLREWKASSFNARAETVETAASFRQAYRSGRALAPAAGFYEWRKAEGGKTPFYLHPGDNAPTLTFAALWSHARLPDFEGPTCAILTEPAAPDLAWLHDRQPVMLGPEGVEAWLAGAPVADVPRLAPDRLAWHRVRAAVGSVRSEGPELIEPA